MAKNDSHALRTATATSRQVGVIVRRRPGVTRWARWSWAPVALLPDAAPADWRMLREEDGVTDFHAATMPLTLHRGETEAYRIALSEPVPAAYVVLRPSAPGAAMPWRVHLVTASPHEAALFQTSGDEIVEKVAMPDILVPWVGDWVARHHVEEPFVKRRRRPQEMPVEDGVGDARVTRASDVYRSPTGHRHARQGDDE
ncbi:DUF3305 domain-containing protein [Roseivivax marinus]|uniref:DUF3305 domain-containing protein n=1 Tax=Roseivivax marinus TaxID=1379903 RepID=UPI00273EB124|nr:DUF3305 domain-containing protein [Roseivivax marinus]